MTKTRWKNKIKKACEAAGTYQSFYDSMIDTLASIMETRDEAQREYEESGKTPIVEHTNRGGATNIVKNPALVVIMECNTQALAYWRDLGLTPAGLKRLGDKGLLNRDDNLSLSDVLAGLGI